MWGKYTCRADILVGRTLPAIRRAMATRSRVPVQLPTPVARSRALVRPTRSASFWCRPVDKNAARRPPAAHNLRASRYRPTTPAARPSRDGRRTIVRSPLVPTLPSNRSVHPKPGYTVTRLSRHPVTPLPGNDDDR